MGNIKNLMHNIQPRELQFYQTANGRVPFSDWFDSVRDTRARSRIDARLISLEFGNIGDSRSVGGGVFELRIHVGAGYRIYYSEIDSTNILLLCGGDKSSQQRDIERARSYWQKYQEQRR